MKWINYKENPPKDFNTHGYTKNYLVYIDNPFFEDGNYHVARYQKNAFGDFWIGIEPSIHHGKDTPNVTHYSLLPKKP